MRERPARNFPITISLSRTGSVVIISIVPRLFSLEIRPMETAGIKKRYTKGTIPNSDLISD
jgi:hypothetical protein